MEIKRLHSEFHTQRVQSILLVQLLCLLPAPEPVSKLGPKLHPVVSLELEHTKIRQQVSPICLFSPHFKAWSCDPKLSTSTHRCLGCVVTACSLRMQPGKSSWISTTSHPHQPGTSRRAGRDAGQIGMQPQNHGIVVWKRSSSPTLDPALPRSPLNLNPKCHICASFKSLWGW